jgi:hypothetical protein
MVRNFTSLNHLFYCCVFQNNLKGGYTLWVEEDTPNIFGEELIRRWLESSSSQSASPSSPLPFCLLQFGWYYAA